LHRNESKLLQASRLLSNLLFFAQFLEEGFSRAHRFRLALDKLAVSHLELLQAPVLLDEVNQGQETARTKAQLYESERSELWTALHLLEHHREI